MPYKISWHDGSAMDIAYSGQTGDREVLAVVKLQHGDERFDTLRMVLHDFTAIEACSYSDQILEELDCLTFGAWRTNPRFKIAIVTDRQDVIDMVMAFQKERLDAYPLRIFPTVAVARAWLER